MNTTLQNYFAQPDSPSAGSPVGVLMLKILEKYPDLSFDAARVEAWRLLDKAAGRFHFSMPRVLSPEQREAAKARFRGLDRSPNIPALAFAGVTSPTESADAVVKCPDLGKLPTWRGKDL